MAGSLLQGTRESRDGHVVTGKSSQISHNDRPQLFRSSDCGDAHIRTIHLVERMKIQTCQRRVTSYALKVFRNETQ